MKCLLGMILLLLLSGAAALGQSSLQLVTINSSRFDERNHGIHRLEQTIDVVLNNQPCHHGCAIRNDIKTLENEILRLTTSNLPLGNLEERLRSRTKELTDLLIQNYRKNEKLLVEPIKTEIQENLKRFATDRNYVIVDTMSESLLFVSRDLPDVTVEFIAFCNEEFARSKNKGNHGT